MKIGHYSLSSFIFLAGIVLNNENCCHNSNRDYWILRFNIKQEREREKVTENREKEG